MHSQFMIETELTQIMGQNKQSASLNMLPDQILNFVIGPLLDTKSSINLSNASCALFKRSNHKAYWYNKIMALFKNNPAEIKKVLSADIIFNVRRFYITLTRMKPYDFAAWELCCLSGDLTAIQHAIEHFQLTSDKTGWGNRNPLHHAAWSGSASAMRFVDEFLAIALDAEDWWGENALDYAKKSGSKAAIMQAKILNIPSNTVKKILRSLSENFNKINLSEFNKIMMLASTHRI